MYATRRYWGRTRDYRGDQGAVTFIRCLSWRRCGKLLEQVWHILGAGKVFGEGPAPRIGHPNVPVAQISCLFPHLRQKTYTPAPPKPYTCARKATMELKGPKGEDLGDSACRRHPLASGGFLTRQGHRGSCPEPPVLFCHPTLCKQACNGRTTKKAPQLRCDALASWSIGDSNP